MSPIRRAILAFALIAGIAPTIAQVPPPVPALPIPPRTRLTAPLTLFVDSSLGSDSNLCLTAGTGACKTITHAATIVCNNIEPNGQQISIQLTSGEALTENVALCNYLDSTLPAENNTPLIIGDPSVPSSYGIEPASGIAITAVNVRTPWIISGLTIRVTGGSGTCIEADINSFIYVSGNVIFAGCGIAVQSLYGGKVEFIGPTSFGGVYAGAFLSAEFGGQILTQAAPMTCVTGPVFGVFAQAIRGGLISWGAGSFSGCGSATGARYQAALGGGVDTNGGGASFFPGNAGGTTTSPGWYN
jgi:hypothetical protein